MKVLIQRVLNASVTVENKTIGSIKKGLLVFVGIGQSDTKDTVEKYVDKLCKLRIFEDSNGKTNLSLNDVNGELLIVSQFTLYANCKKGNRPNFMSAGSPQLGEQLYNYFIELCKTKIEHVETGSFGADMKVSLINDGPFTIFLDNLEE